VPRHLLLVVLLTVAVPFQAALAASAAPEMAVEKCHDGHDGHAKASGSHCGACCTAAVAGAINALPASPFHGAVSAGPRSPLLAELPVRLDRPPRSR
jgi:hypothetical protein